MSYIYLKLLLIHKLNKMKRIIIIIVVLILAIALTSCESKSGKRVRLAKEQERLEVKNPAQLVRIEYLAKQSRVELVRVDAHQYIILGVDNVIVHSEGCPCKK